MSVHSGSGKIDREEEVCRERVVWMVQELYPLVECLFPSSMGVPQPIGLQGDLIVSSQCLRVNRKPTVHNASCICIKLVIHIFTDC